MPVQQHILNWLYSVLTSVSLPILTLIRSLLPKTRALTRHRQEYHDVNRAYNDVAQALTRYPTLAPRTDVHSTVSLDTNVAVAVAAVLTSLLAFANGANALLLHLSGTLPVNFRGTTYRFPVSIWVPHAYPREPPLVYVVPTEAMMVRPGQHVDPQGQVYHPYLVGWAEFWDKSNIQDFLAILTDIFAKEPPVISRQQVRPNRAPQPSQTPPPVPPLPPGMASRPNNQAQPATQQPRPPPPPPKPFQSMSPSQTSPSSAGPPLPPMPMRSPDESRRPSRYDSAPPLPPNGGGAGPPDSRASQTLSWHQISHVTPNESSGFRQNQYSNEVQPHPATQQGHWHISQQPPTWNQARPPRQVQAVLAPPPDLLDEPLDLKKDALLQHLGQTLCAIRIRSRQQNESSMAGLQAQRTAMLSVMPALQLEAGQLTQLGNVLTSNSNILHDALHKADAVIEGSRNHALPDVDELLVAPTVVSNQLYTLVAEERALGDAIFMLGRAVERGRITPAVFAKMTRSLAREWYLKKALVQRLETAPRWLTTNVQGSLILSAWSYKRPIGLAAVIELRAASGLRGLQRPRHHQRSPTSDRGSNYGIEAGSCSDQPHLERHLLLPAWATNERLNCRQRRSLAPVRNPPETDLAYNLVATTILSAAATKPSTISTPESPRRAYHSSRSIQRLQTPASTTFNRHVVSSLPHLTSVNFQYLLTYFPVNLYIETSSSTPTAPAHCPRHQSSHLQGPANKMIDPFTQNVSFTRVSPEGATQTDVPMQFIDQIQSETISVCINYGAQLGACFIMLVIVLITTPSSKFRRPSNILHILGLFVCTVRTGMLSAWFLSPFNEFYIFFGADYTTVPRYWYNYSIGTNTVSLILVIIIEAALMNQAWTMVSLWPDVWKYTISFLSVLITLSTIGWRIAFAVMQNQSILGAHSAINHIWVMQGTIITNCLSISWFCALFNVKLITHLVTNRAVLPSYKNMTPMEVLIMTNGILMIVPVIFAGLEWGHFANFEAASLALTSVAIILPLGTIAAQRMAHTTNFSYASASSSGRHGGVILNTYTSSTMPLKGTSFATTRTGTTAQASILSRCEAGMSSRDRINPISVELSKFYPDVDDDRHVRVDRDLEQREERL
ncbi:hypothetical protein G7046_g7434 [Stylonectria norvegica]|nr:hypothetical protein G7046_g7434 [Stylonectria norvegica]